jgi:hypothetical protein
MILPLFTPALVQQAPEDSGGLSVVGAGLVLARPDLARLMLTLESKNKDVVAAARSNATRLDAVLRTLKKAGIAEKDIQTSGVEIGTEEDRKTRSVSSSVEVVVRDVRKVGRIIDGVLAAGASGVSSLVFEAKDPSPLYDEALRRAVADARRKARVLSAAVKAPIELVSITESGPVPFTSFAAHHFRTNVPAEGSGRFSTPVVPNKIEVRAGVTLKFRFLDAPLREKE